MRYWKIVLALLALSLSGCAPMLAGLDNGPTYSADEIELLLPNSSERWVYFFGDPQTVSLNGAQLKLSEPPAYGHVWAIPEALWVNGQPLYREVLPALRLPARTVEALPGFSYHVETRADLKSVWLYDNRWYLLAGRVAAGKTADSEGQPQTPSFQGLSDAETSLLLRELLERNPVRPLVIYELNDPVYPDFRLSPPPRRYRKSSFAVQYGVDKEFFLKPSSPNPPAGDWKVVQKGVVSAYRDPNPYAIVAENERDFISRIWPLAAGNRIPRPAPPQLDLDRYSLAAFFWGSKPSGGYAVDVAKVVQKRGGVVAVYLKLQRPAPGSIVTQMITSPYVLIEISGKPRIVRFYDDGGRLIEEVRAK